MVALIVIQFIDSPHHRYRSLIQSLSRSLSLSKGYIASNMRLITV